MSEVNKHITLPKSVATSDDLDYAFLRKKGQEYIEKLSGSIWTDYNEHDPGITILEMLCYAITDLGARINMPLENILTPPEGGGSVADQFYRAIQILPSKPLAEADYRKLFIDIDGVKNCWLRKFEKTVYVDCKNNRLSFNRKDFADIDKEDRSAFVLNGLYRVIVDFDEEVLKDTEDEEAKKQEIRRAVRTLYHSNRNLCEDLVKVEEVQAFPVQVCASIEVRPEVDEELVHAKVLWAIDKYFSPGLRFYSLQEMLDKGYTTAQIFEGPLLHHGFIDPNELAAAKLRKEVRLSDLVQLIMDIEGVRLIRDISINDCSENSEAKNEWQVCVPNDKKPVRCHQGAFSYYKGVLPVNVNSKKVKEYLEILRATEKSEQELAGVGMDIPVPNGEFLSTGETTTIQNDFPETYGIGKLGLSSKASAKRRAQAKQLKAYLLFFDQVFASYFAHLDKVKDILSVDSKLAQTYFTQAVQDVRGLAGIVDEYSSDPGVLTEKLLSELDNNIPRKNKVLDHLLARFAEKFSEYSFLMKELYGSFADQSIINAKEVFLSEYGEKYNVYGESINHGISNWRGSAFNYFRQKPKNLWDTENVAGAQKRIARLCGIKDYRRRKLSGSFAEIYDLIDSDGEKVYRWRIWNQKGEAVLSATVNYKAPRFAETEMYQSVVKVVECDPDLVTKAFEKEMKDEAVVANFEIQRAESGLYSFDVINVNADPKSADRIIARQFLYYDTQTELLEAILDLIKFLRTDFAEEGMFIVENILLRPNVNEKEGLMDQFMPVCTDGCESCEPVDPYSYRVTVVLPGWTYRFRNMDFRNFMEELIRRELPAHVLARICWIGERAGTVEDSDNDMIRFEQDYKEFLLRKTKSGQAQNAPVLKKLINTLTYLNSIYPTGRLIDCEDEEDSLKGRIVLGRTNIGNL